MEDGAFFTAEAQAIENSIKRGFGVEPHRRIVASGRANAVTAVRTPFTAVRTPRQRAQAKPVPVHDISGYETFEVD